MSNIERIIDHRNGKLSYVTKSLVFPPDGSVKKICSKCKKSLPIESGFHVTSRIKGDTKYLYNHCKCKECRRAERRSYYKDGPKIISKGEKKK